MVLFDYSSKHLEIENHTRNTRVKVIIWTELRQRSIEWILLSFVVQTNEIQLA